MSAPETVADVMTPEVVVLREEDNLLEVATDMDKLHFRHVPVVDGERLVGLVSQRDLLRYTVSKLELGPAASARDSSMKEQTFVGKVMTRSPETVTPETSIKEAARKLRSGKFGCLPVVGPGNELLGILTSHDLLKILAEG